MQRLPVGAWFAVAGAVLVIVTTLPVAFVDPGALLFALPFALWGCVPYGALAFGDRFLDNKWIVGGAGVAALAVEAGIRASVMLFPSGSTAAIALVFSPAWILLIAMPAGGVLGFVAGLAWRAGPMARVPVGLIAAVLTALTVLWFAKPDMFPTAVIERRAALDAIGEPRIVAGAAAFERIEVSATSGWYQVTDLDDAPGDEIAIVTHDRAELVDARDLTRRATVPFGGEKGRLINWYSKLIRTDAGLRVVQTGGGYQETELRSLENALLWRYRPDPKLPPSALLPGDLDRDGIPEFYASTVHAISRLDLDGRVVWTNGTTLAHLVTLAPPRDNTPAWIVGEQYQGRVHVFEPGGLLLAELPAADAPVIGVVDWPEARYLVIGGTRVRGRRLDGGFGFDRPLADGMVLTQAVSIRWKPSEPSMLALVLSAGRDVKRWRFQILGAGEQTVYDEILDRPISLHVAETPESSLLLVAGNGLAALKPR